MRALYEDQSGRVWMGGADGAQAFVTNDFVNPIIDTASLGVKEVHCILQTRDGKDFYFGEKGRGIARLRDGAISYLNRSNGLSSDNVWCIHEDANGALWFGTDDGLTRFANGKCFAFASRHGLPESTVNWLLEDDFVFLWLSGLNGIYRISLSELNAVAAKGDVALPRFGGQGVNA